MKTWKIIDLIAQVLMIVGFVIAAIAGNSNAYISGYFIVGAWQLTSMLIHNHNKWHTRKGSPRFIFQIVVVLTILFTAISVIIPLSGFLPTLLFVASVLVVSYALLSYKEIVYYSKRPLELI
ncbi:MAG: hypothetical protein JWQ96_1129 [Segetibacter sp.]|nr:hypothetical protein [Segetibacter sp.]